jgi:hypothetical protein
MTSLFVCLRVSLVVLLLMPIVAFAQPKSAKKKSARPNAEKFSEPVSSEPVDYKEYYRYWIHQPLVEAGKFKGAPPCPGCDVAKAQAAGENELPAERCPAAYRDIYKPRTRSGGFFFSPKTVNPDLDIRLALGYLDEVIDGERVSFDKYVAEAMIDNLQLPCDQPGAAACDFEIDNEDPESGDFTVLTKMIVDPFSKKPRKVRIVVGHSSASTSERANTSGFGQFKQQERTRRTENMFLDGVKNANAAFYVGHARRGGGPSFEPPVRNARGQVDYNYYLSERPGMRKLTEALSSTPDPVPLLGAFACQPDNLYKPDLKASTSKTALMLAGRGTFESVAAQAMGAIDSMLALRCEKQTRATMNAITGGVYGRPVDPVTIDGLFKK